jgi:hypothetical protein
LANSHNRPFATTTPTSLYPWYLDGCSIPCSLRLKRTHSTGWRGVHAGNVQQRASRCASTSLPPIASGGARLRWRTRRFRRHVHAIDRGAHGDCDVQQLGGWVADWGCWLCGQRQRCPYQQVCSRTAGSGQGCPRSHHLRGLSGFKCRDGEVTMVCVVPYSTIVL